MEVQTAADPTPAEPSVDTNAQPASHVHPQSKEEVLDRLRAIVAEGGDTDRAELELLKQIYYKQHNAEATAAREQFISEGGAPEDFMPAVDATEQQFKELFAQIKERRRLAAEKLEQEKQQNLSRKLEIIEKVKQMAASPEEADAHYEEFKTLQAEWKEIKAVPAEKATELWKNYQLYVEQYYDLLRLGHELRAYDFKKNLETKTRLCEEAEALANLEDPVDAFHKLQQLHVEFRETGPVAKELRDEIWLRFKAASTVVNKRHQDHFEQLKAQEEENLRLKTQLCEQAEAIDTAALKSVAEWDAQTQAVLAWQAEWRSIGFTPKRVNTEIFERFRSACDRFFQSKTAYFKQLRDSLNTNLDIKTRLCEQAEALKDSTDWGTTTKALQDLQQQWKQTGPAPRKAGGELWQRFNEACNQFFRRKAEANSAVHEQEEENMKQKEQVITELEALLANPEGNIQATVRTLQQRWSAIGHVPFKQKDKIYDRFRDVCNRIYKDLHVQADRRRLESFKKTVEDKAGSELLRELQRLQTAYEAKRNEISNYETNLSFLTSKSKAGNSLVEDISRRINRLKEDLTLLGEKIRAVRQQAKQGEAE